MTSIKQTWRLFTSHALNSLTQVQLDSDEFHYAIHVLRLGTNEEVELCNGQGEVAKARLTQVNKKEATLSIEDLKVHTRALGQVHVFLGLPKPAALEEVVTSISELGASSLHLYRAARSHFRNEPKIEKLQRQCRESLRINKSAFAMDILYHSDYSSLKASSYFQNCSVIFLCDESLVSYNQQKTGHVHLLDALTQYIKTKCQNGNIGIFIGPEASFSPDEIVKIMSEPKVTAVSLGLHILRVPLAASAAVSLSMATFESAANRPSV